MMRKIAFSGTYGTGKTTSVLGEAHKLKLVSPHCEVTILSEVARDCPWPINKHTTPRSQMWIFTEQMRREQELLKDNTILVCDRTIVDCIAYTTYAGFKELADNMMVEAEGWIRSYDTIIFKDILSNPFHVADGVREVEDVAFRTGVQQILLSLYQELGVTLSYASLPKEEGTVE